MAWHRAALFGLTFFALLAAFRAVWTLESARALVPERVVATEAGPVTLYGEGARPVVIVAHGFAGSTQMMQSLSRDLARAGLRVAAFDFAGHGRNGALMSPDVTRIEGTTAQLVDQTLDVTRAVRDQFDWRGPIALVGHSMATDIVIRAAEQIDDVAAIVAISMYSDAVTATAPERLLIVSGAWEGRLREVALDNLRLVAPTAQEGETATQGPVTRRAAVAPGVEHVGVLYSRATLAESRDWLFSAFDLSPDGVPRSQGAALLALLISLTILGVISARILPHRSESVPPLAGRMQLAVTFLPVMPAMAAAWLIEGAGLGIAGFGALAVFFAVWGAVALILLARAGRWPGWPDPVGIVVLGVMCLVFALALDRYGASFVPTGPRAGVMAVMLIGTLPFMLADRLAAAGAATGWRIAQRAAPILALFALMLVAPQPFGLMFTVLPVMVLFYLVFGTMGAAVARRSGAASAGIALGVVLAWSIAASQPLFATAL